MASVVELLYSDFTSTLDRAVPEKLYRQGQTLARLGDEIIDVHLVRNGLLKLRWTASNGKSVIGAIWPGPLALGGFFGGRCWKFSIEVVEECRVISVSRQTFDSAVARHPIAALQIALHQNALLESELNRNARFACSSPQDRLLQFLQSLLGTKYCTSSGKGFKLKMPLRQYELAAFLNVTPEHLSRLLTRLVKLGIVHRDHGWYILQHSAFGHASNCEHE